MSERANIERVHRADKSPSSALPHGLTADTIAVLDIRGSFPLFGPESRSDVSAIDADKLSMSETLLTARKFSVERREYDVPGVGRVRRELVVHPGAVLILPVLGEKNVVMIHNYRFAAGKELLELPAGTLEPSEAPVDCAARELQEETGYVAGSIEPLCEFFTTPGLTDEYMYVFLANDLTQTAQQLDKTEQIRVEIMSFDDALQATVDGRIVDAKTIAALHIYHHKRASAS